MALTQTKRATDASKRVPAREITTNSSLRSSLVTAVHPQFAQHVQLTLNSWTDESVSQFGRSYCQKFMRLPKAVAKVAENAAAPATAKVTENSAAPTKAAGLSVAEIRAQYQARKLAENSAAAPTAAVEDSKARIKAILAKKVAENSAAAAKAKAVTVETAKGEKKTFNPTLSENSMNQALLSMAQTNAKLVAKLV